MVNKIFNIVFLFTVIVGLSANGQILPAHKSTLHYRLIGFSVPKKDSVTNYEFEISECGTNKSGTEECKTVIKKSVSDNELVTTVPHYGKMYTWKVNYYHGDKLIGSSDNYRFITRPDAVTDTTLYRNRVIKNELKTDELYFLLDGKGVLCNTDGEVLWYLPTLPGVKDSGQAIRDLKVTHDNTFTFVTKGNAYEIDYNANVLWKGPNDGMVSKDTFEDYHHELTKLKNGNYMVLGREQITLKIPDVKDNSIYENEYKVEKRADGYYKTIFCGTVIEYDTAGKVVWKWKASEHFTLADFFSRKTPSGTVNSNTHMNSFYFDEQKNVIYVGYRDINRIMKIAYPSGEVIAQYGEDYTGERKVNSGGLFHAHHNNTINSDGHILLFSNNTRQRGRKGPQISNIAILEETNKSKPGVKLIWKLDGNVDNLTTGFTAAEGGVCELSNRNMLVSMGLINRIFVVTREKNVVWDMFTESKIGSSNWELVGNYRASAIESNKHIEKITLLKRD